MSFELAEEVDNVVVAVSDGEDHPRDVGGVYT